ncbi:uncharacterized protein RCC_01584 [Ramularia collo-cygni]|uniref:DNA-directed RNA polymerase III subunit n=1 Tax=Ramularia collo-cygni TaxID=112498 RepID=A0A2D3USR7_9PEZI|nr:uncharacterized protein RCC_01584 [Ramularia collo-cygni]CZT15750.1 uncharacterized protein RCC_01584 [Ramularia collo-cygni]
MSRGGRGGGPAGVGRMNGQALPFDVDTALEDQVALNSYQTDDWANSMFPPMNVHMAPSATTFEKKLVQIMRETNEDRRNSPFYLGDATGKRDASTFNAFEDVNTFSYKKAKRLHSEKPDLDNVPLIREILPPELAHFATDGDDPTVVSEARAKNLAFLKKKRIDKLARFDEGADADAPADDDDDDDDKDGDGDEDGVEAPSDNDFSEDDSDMGDDYNAEKYFDDGEGDDDGGGEEGGGGDDWS